MAQYSPPEWSHTGRNVFGIYLEVIKSGVVVEKVHLPRSDDRSYTVAGRMETVCDLALVHQSISRVHAALQFDEQGALFLYDIRSTHGCYVNKKRIPAAEFVRLHIGDVIVFGESTRMYAVCGPAELLPAEYESLNLAKFRDKMDRKRELREKTKQQEEGGVSWGFREDAEEEESDDDEEELAKTKEDLPDYLRNLKEEDQPYESSVSQSQVNEKDQRLYQQLQTRIRKMENLKLEKARILAKQNLLEGLSEGQQNTVLRNEQRIDALMKEIDELEARIHAKNEQRTTTSSLRGSLSARKKRNINEELYGYSSDEDDFYDRTQANQEKLAARKQKITGSTDALGKATRKQAPKSEVLTADLIMANIKQLEASLSKLHDELTVASRTAADNKSTSEESTETKTMDSLDSFMATTATQLFVSEVETLTKRKQAIETKLKRQKQLLAVATPALAALPVQKPVVNTMEEDSVKISSIKSPVQIPVSMKSPSEDKAEGEAQDLLPEPDSVAKDLETHVGDRRKIELAPSNSSNDMVQDSAVLKRRRIVGPAKGPSRPTKSSASDEQFRVDPSLLEGGDQVWVPPANQTGDGRTELNDKYGY